MYRELLRAIWLECNYLFDTDTGVPRDEWYDWFMGPEYTR